MDSVAKEWIPLADPVRISESMLWDVQKAYYKRAGMKAWAQVPSYITNSRVMAETYTDLMMCLFRDRPEVFQGRTVYLLEVGAGLGRLGFHLVNALWRKVQAFARTREIRWKLILSDMTEEVVRFWEEHPAFKAMTQAGLLDFNLYDLKVDGLKLRVSGEHLQPGCGPLVTIANYVFDSLPHDEFKIENGILHDCYIQMMRTPNPEWSEGEDWDIRDLRYHKTYKRAMAYSCYGRKLAWNRILRDYRVTVANGSITFPKGALEMIADLQRLAGDHFVLLTSDRGFTALETMAMYSDHPYEMHDGAFSHMVNYDAIGRSFANAGGMAWATRHGCFNGLQTLCGLSPAFGHGPFEELTYYFEERMNRFNPINTAAEMHELVRERPHRLHQAIVGFLRLSGCDPEGLAACAKKLGEAVPHLTVSERAHLGGLLEEVAQNLFLYPGITNSPFWLSYIFMQLERYDRAAHFLRLTMEHVGEDDMLWQLLGDCLYQLGDPGNVACYEKAKAMREAREAAATR